MKYNIRAVMHEGEAGWAIHGGGRSYYPSSFSTSEDEARQEALIWSIKWYEEKKCDAWKELAKLLGGDKYDDTVFLIGDRADELWGKPHPTTLPDLLC